MSQNSLFAILLRSPWWIGLVLAVAVGAVAAALLPETYRVAGALSGFPFAVIAFMALRRQWGQPSAQQIAATLQTVGDMAWPQLLDRIEQGFVRDGYSVQRGKAPPLDLAIERQGRRTLVSARRWKSAHIGIEALRALRQARDDLDAADALLIGLGEPTASAREYAAEHGIRLWDGAALARHLHRTGS